MSSLLTFLIVSFEAQKFLILRSLFIVFLLLLVLLVLYLRIHCQSQGHEDLLLCFLLRVLYYIFALTLKYLSHFELVFVYGVREGSNFILLHVGIRLSQEHLLRSLFFPLLNSFDPLVEKVDHRHMSLFLDSQFYSIDLCVYPYASTTLS